MKCKGASRYQLLQVFMQFCCSFAILSPINMHSQNVILYDNTNSMKSSTNFTVSFNRSFLSYPTIWYGLNDDRTLNHFTNYNIFTNVTSIKTNSFVILVMRGLSSQITKLSISYLAIPQQPNFLTLWNSYINPLISNNGSHFTSIVIQKSYNFSSPQIKGAHFITGFFIASTVQYGINILITSITKTHYQLSISTVLNCTLSRIDVSLLFYYPNSTAQNYSINLDLRTFSYSNINKPFMIETIQRASSSVFILALSSFSGYTSKNMVTFGWFIEDSASDPIRITINTASFINLHYTFVQISNYQPSVPTSTSTQMTLSTLLIIILVPTIATIAIIVTSVCCWRMYKWKYQNKITRDSITQLPSLAF